MRAGGEGGRQPSSLGLAFLQTTCGARVGGSCSPKGAFQAVSAAPDQQFLRPSAAGREENT